MKYNIRLKIECGKTTCAAVPGKFCRFLRTTMNGKASCHLFGRIFDKDGWLQRHPDCLRMARLDTSQVRRIKK